jgi:hypothetical protein
MGQKWYNPYYANFLITKKTMTLHIKPMSMIRLSDWDELVVKTYGRPYNFQQQDGCRSRGTLELYVPEEFEDDYPETISEDVHRKERGVSFSAWLARDPKQPLPRENAHLQSWWCCKFYPNIQMVANDLYARGILPRGDYVIKIDW